MQWDFQFYHFSSDHIILIIRFFHSYWTSRASQGVQCKEFACQCRRCKRHRFDPWVRRIPWRRKWQPIPVFLPGKFHGQRSLAGCSPRVAKVGQDWAHKDTDRHTAVSTYAPQDTQSVSETPQCSFHPNPWLQLNTLLATGMSRQLRLMTRATHPSRYAA